MKKINTSLISIISVIAVALVFKSTIIELIEKLTGGTNKSEIEIEEHINEIEVDYTEGLTANQAKNMSIALLNGFNHKVWGFFGGTDKEAITNIFVKMEYSQDYLKIYKEFGYKKYNGMDMANDNNPLYNKLDLTGWLHEELDFTDSDLKMLVKEKITDSGLIF